MVRTVETVTMETRLALTLEGSEFIDASGINVTRRRAALVYI